MFRTLLFSLFSSAACADTFVTDAFGILPESAMSEVRGSWAGLQTGTSAVVVEPRSPDAVLLFIGAKSLVAGKDEGHAVALSLDKHGNLIQDTVADFVLETNETQSANIRDGLADVFFFPEPIAGTFTGGADVGGTQSARALYRVVADLASVRPSMQSSDPLKTENFETFSSHDLVDQFGNQVEDGIGVTLQLTHRDGTTTQLSAPVRETQAEATLLVRDIKSGGQVRAILGNKSETMRVEFEPLQAIGPTKVLLWRNEALDAVALRVGPLGTDAGHVLVDGSPITATVVTENETFSQSGWLLEGYFETLLPLSADATSYEVTISTVLGEQTSTELLSEKPKNIRGAE